MVFDPTFVSIEHSASDAIGETGVA